MENVNGIKIPEYIVQLCSLNLNSVKHNASVFEKIVLNNTYLQLLVERTFNRNEFSSLRQMFTSIGLRTIRNKLVSQFVYKTHHRQTMTHPPMIEMKHIVEFENDYEVLGMNGNNRIFLLGLFLDLVRNNSDEEIKLPRSVVKLIKDGKSSPERIDYLCLTLLAMERIYKDDLPVAVGRYHGNFKKLFQEAGLEHRKKILKPIIFYANAIDDYTIFQEFKKVS